jgi:hypothetical protein
MHRHLTSPRVTVALLAIGATTLAVAQTTTTGTNPGTAPASSASTPDMSGSKSNNTNGTMGSTAPEGNSADKSVPDPRMKECMSGPKAVKERP